MDTGHKFGLVMMYSVIAVYALLILRLLIQLFFGAAIENHRRRQWMQEHGGAAHTFGAVAVNRGWANAWLPKSPEVNLPASKGKVTSGRVTLPLLVSQAIGLIFILIALGLASTVAAQQRPARDSSSDLKKQLLDIRAKEVQLRIRLEQIDQELKPEAIERELAGIGSVHPEELRENRRKLLTIERNGLQAQLDLLEEYRAGIEAAIVIDEEAAALMKYERPAPAKPSPEPQMSLALRNIRRPQLVLKLFGALSILITLTAGLILLLLVGFQLFAQIGTGKTPGTRSAALRGKATVQPIAAAALPLERA